MFPSNRFYFFASILVTMSFHAHAEQTQDNSTENQVEFDPIFLKTAGVESVDLSRFESGSSALPGKYDIQIYSNGNLVTKDSVQFIEVARNDAEPCLSDSAIKQMNLKYDALSDAFKDEMKKGKQCYLISKILPEARVDYDSGEQRLDITLPQAMVNNTARGYVSPELWDKGIPGLFLGYNANAYTTQSHGDTYNSAYAGINAGLNIGAWYFRHDGSFNWQDQSGGHYESINNYVQRDIPVLQAQARIGQSNTRGTVFDTLPYTGVELATDDRMLPQSQRGYAPEIRGVARTNAKVSIKQNGRVIYETTVTPGAFVIDDLYPTGYGGDLDVTVTEADGSTQNFKVPYTSVSQLLRPGNHKFDVVIGKLNDNTLHEDPLLYELTWQQGLTNNLTGYAGLQEGGIGRPNYYALLVGGAVSTSVGAFSFDITQARVHLDSLDDHLSSGQSYQISYSKYLRETGSNLTLAAYRYSTQGYYDFSDAMQAIDQERHGGDINNVWRPRNKFNITLNQTLPDDYGQLYLTGYSQDYWDNGETDLQYQIGYSNSWKRISYNINAGRVRNQYGDMETNRQLSIVVPIGNDSSSNIPTLTASVTHDTGGRTGEQLGISGTAGADSQYSYGVTGSNYNDSAGSSVAMNAGWRTPYTNLSASYGAGSGYHNASVGMSGTLLAWSGGAVLSPYTGDNFAIVEAKGASGAKVGGYSGVRIDPWGHAAVPYLNPYELNDITIDPRGVSDTVELGNTSEKVAPYDGAISKITFKTRTGTPVLIMAKLSDGLPVPFGAEVLDQSHNVVGSVGQSGMVYARVAEQKGELTVSWGNDSQHNCQLRYMLIPQGKNTKAEIQRFNSTCVTRDN